MELSVALRNSKPRCPSRFSALAPISRLIYEFYCTVKSQAWARTGRETSSSCATARAISRATPIGENCGVASGCRATGLVQVLQLLSCLCVILFRTHTQQYPSLFTIRGDHFAPHVETDTC